MKNVFVTAIAINGLLSGASAQLLGLDLDIEGLLKSLGPAPANDPRFTTWTAPGPHDGTFEHLGNVVRWNRSLIDP
jgi:hypothetical protein